MGKWYLSLHPDAEVDAVVREARLSRSWHELEYQCETEAIKEWCRENGIELTHDE